MATPKKRYGKQTTYSKKAKRRTAKKYATKDMSPFAALAKSLNPIKLSKIPELAVYTEEVDEKAILNFAYAAEPTEDVAVSLNRTMGCCRVLHNKFVENLYSYLDAVGYDSGFITGYKTPPYREMLVAIGKDYMNEPDMTAYVNVRESFEKSIKTYNEQYAPKGKQYRKRAIRRVNGGGAPLTFRDLKGMLRFHAKHYCVDSYKSNKVGSNIKLIAPSSEEIYTDNFHHGNYKDFRIRAKLKLPKLPELDVLIHRPMPKGSKIKTIVVTREKNGKYTVTLSVEFTTIRAVRLKKTPEAKAAVKEYLFNHPELALGLDYSQQEGCVGSESKLLSELINLAFGKNFRHKEARIAYLQRKLRKKQKPNYKQGIEASGSYLKLQQKIAKLQVGVAHRRKDALDKLSRVIADTFLLVAVEDINLRGLSQTLNLAKNLLDNGFGMFRQMLLYKLAEQGKFYVVIDKWFASTQTCEHCGYKNPETKNLSVKEWNCPNCGEHNGRDLNAAINIRNEGIRTLEKAKIFAKRNTKATVAKYTKKTAA